MSKKGALTDLFIYMAVIFIMVLFMVAMTFVANQTKTELLKKADILQGHSTSYNATNLINETLGGVTSSYDSLKWISVMLMIGFAMSILVTSFLVRTNPVFFVPYAIIVVVAVIMAVPLSNSYDTLYNNPTLHSTFVGFFGASYIFSYLPIWITIIGFVAGILMFVNVVRSEPI